MMKRLKQSMLLLVSFFVITNTHAQQPLLSDVSFDAVLALSAREPDAQIGYGSADRQFGELWLPDTRLQPAPLIVLIHGGCWLNSCDISHTYGLNTALANMGFAVWALEYRSTGDADGGWPGTYQDIELGLQIIDTLGNRGVDTERVAVLGHSAGGHLALLAGANQQLAESIDLVVGLAAIVDIEQYSLGDNSCQTATPLFMNGTAQEIPQDYAAANPARMQTHTRTVLMHGDVDQIVPLSQADLDGAEIRIFEGAGHFDWIHPDTGAFAYLMILLEEAL